MSLVNVANMVVLDNPAPFGNPLQFEITFECLQALEDGKSFLYSISILYQFLNIFDNC